MIWLVSHQDNLFFRVVRRVSHRVHIQRLKRAMKAILSRQCFNNSLWIDMYFIVFGGSHNWFCCISKSFLSSSVRDLCRARTAESTFANFHYLDHGNDGCSFFTHSTACRVNFLQVGSFVCVCIYVCIPKSHDKERDKCSRACVQTSAEIICFYERTASFWRCICYIYNI